MNTILFGGVNTEILENMDEFKNRRKIAMFIDGDNAEAALFENVFAEVSKWGIVTIRQIYGDVSTNKLKSWKDVIPLYAILPVHQPPYTTGKNSTDTALIIDAMDILNDDLADIFCIVSSDSDYTKLAMRIRKSGKYVIGVGRKITPTSFRKACDKFIDTDIFKEEKLIEKVTNQKEKVKRKPENPLEKSKEIKVEEVVKKNEDPLPIIIQAYEKTSNDEGMARLADMGYYINRLIPDFEPRTYGYPSSKLLPLIRAYPEIFDVTTPKEGYGAVYVKMKDK